jgi:hypothetical protein
MFDYLRETLGHEVSFEMIEAKISLKDSAQQWRFDNIVLLTPSIKGKISNHRNSFYRKHNRSVSQSRKPHRIF